MMNRWYCERQSAELFAEPVNTLSNIAFFLAAAAMLRLMRQRPALNTSTCWILLVLTLAIGIGSSLFHLTASRWAAILDVVPILFFQVFFLWSYLKHTLGVRSAIVGTMIFFSLCVGVAQVPWLLNRSITYLPAAIAMLVLAAIHIRISRATKYRFILAAMLFVVSLTFRTLDHQLCTTFPSGTHWLWHLCNGAVLYLVFCCHAELVTKDKLISS